MAVRPLNETEQDRERQEKARAKFELHLVKTVHAAMSAGKKAAPMPPPIRIETVNDTTLYRCDWAIFNGDALIAWAEYKYRGPAIWGDYKSVLLSLSKWMHMKELAQQSGKPFFLLFEWADYLVGGKWPPHTGMGYDITWGGRFDRAQYGDLEPVIMIPNSEFKVIK